MHVHRNTNFVFGAESELDVARNDFIELVGLVIEALMLLVGPTIVEVDREELTVSNKDLVLHIHGNTNSVFGAKS